MAPPPAISGPAALNGHATPTGIAATSAAASDAGHQDAEPPSRWSDSWAHVPSWMTSMVLHLSFVLLLAMLGTVHHFRHSVESTVVSTDDGVGAGGLSDDPQSSLLPVAGGLEAAPAIPIEQLPDVPDATALADLISPITAELPKAPPELKVGGAGGTNETELTGSGGAGGGEGKGFSLQLRGAFRAGEVRRGGPTGPSKDSEYAVELALHWLAEHQNYDGSWSFEHQKSPKCHGSCRNPGYTPGHVAATSLALLPFLGTGQTHLEGQYKRNIEQGLKYLVRSMQMQGELGSLYEVGGQMYGHGLASIALCEAYGMTHDQTLKEAAQAAINFIVAAQDTHGGGWRYRPGEPGDTSVVGWQTMAL
ncbi:MAG TPA: prenyltransferase/squalene oxidase repeat-containing protein, partial [Pirellulales bacterium]|nr:prenyltransferase/squalene oxidase repeat-containing protein [Pirellulales bacterium]